MPRRVKTQYIHGETCIELARTNDWTEVRRLLATLKQYLVTSNQKEYIVYVRLSKI
jgi:hypothetical protein